MFYLDISTMTNETRNTIFQGTKKSSQNGDCTVIIAVIFSQNRLYITTRKKKEMKTMKIVAQDMIFTILFQVCVKDQRSCYWSGTLCRVKQVHVGFFNLNFLKNNLHLPFDQQKLSKVHSLFCFDRTFLHLQSKEKQKRHIFTHLHLYTITMLSELGSCWEL